MKHILALMAFLAAVPAYANHPGERLDEVMAQKEPSFEAVDVDEIPALNLRDPHGAPVNLESFSDQVIVLSFAPSDCGMPCVNQQALLSEVIDDVNASPMVNLVTFVVVSDADNPVPAHSAKNVVVARPQEPIETVVQRFRALSPDGPEDPLVHVIARGGRHGGIFHGAAFRHINMLLYVNGLTNEH
ncbi:cytochrome-c oxidase [Stappia sp. F7233]|uniref:Cytochrome-c oxidase n=1 Tax=Stappia albiluteola TaxID=2758565 RepID=A0A839A8D0_9HYPH|nr:cytochrome-c oxidase [Stappia albiluteola]MBA5775581.1 cytochrome-c oxidase [Stappia albiluteola]